MVAQKAAVSQGYLASLAKRNKLSKKSDSGEINVHSIEGLQFDIRAAFDLKLAQQRVAEILVA